MELLFSHAESHKSRYDRWLIKYYVRVGVHLIVHVFNDQQHRAVQLPQVPVQSLQAGSMHHCTVRQPPWITLNPSWKSSSQLRGPHSDQCDGVNDLHCIFALRFMLRSASAFL